MLKKSTVSEFHRMLTLQHSFNLMINNIEAYSINAAKMKKSETKAKTDIPVNESEFGRIFCMSFTISIWTKNNVTSKANRPGTALGGTIKLHPAINVHFSFTYVKIVSSWIQTKNYNFKKIETKSCKKYSVISIKRTVRLTFQGKKILKVRYV